MRAPGGVPALFVAVREAGPGGATAPPHRTLA